MGKLVKRKSAGERKKVERERREAILGAARSIFLQFPYADASLETVGRKAGFRKGIAEMYYPTRQELFLRVLREALDPWFAELGAELAGADDALPPTELARRVTASLTADEIRVRLLSVIPTALEYEVEVMPAMTAAQWLRERIEELGARMESRCPALRAGEGVVFLLRLQALLGGVPRMERVSGMFAAALRDAAPALVEVDWAEELAYLASHLAPGTDD